ncbi:MAG TPA: hypothetical protein VMF62_12375 [Acetobacteraceae bacterium]|nr:hypothetical protein [Acetobacteraceae bacterium]
MIAGNASLESLCREGEATLAQLKEDFRRIEGLARTALRQTGHLPRQRKALGIVAEHMVGLQRYIGAALDALPADLAFRWEAILHCLVALDAYLSGAWLKGEASLPQ